MRILRHPGERGPSSRPVCAAIGFFDGVHLGHQQILRQCLQDARRWNAESVVITFDRHPATIVAPSRAPALIHPLGARLRCIAQQGPDTLLLLPFDKERARMPAEDFVLWLHENLGPLAHLCVGKHFRFGHRRAGTVDLLQTIGSRLGFKVHGLASVALDRRPVSSTRIRECIQTGDFDAATQMLGRNYSLEGPVVHGDGAGRQLGFPTANLAVPDLALPPRGVYAVRVRLEDRFLTGALNIGTRPTVGKELALQVEVHLHNFQEDLYEKTLEITPIRKLRGEQRFPDLPALKRQIASDVAEAARLLDGPG